MALRTGTRLGPYEIIAPIGAGGMGEVYKAKDTRLDRTVAIKVLPEHLAKDPERRERFEREARAVSRLNHPHICTLHDIGSENGIDFMVMEHIEGETLVDRLSKGALPLDQALQYGIQVADALDKAHRQAVVHRDLKPGNIMLTKSGAKVLDFGLAKMAVSGSSPDLSGLATEAKPLTEQGAILGTFQYMAPEQLEGKEADSRTDIFAFGAVLYEMLTGRKAFEGKSQASLIAAILEHDPPTLSELQPMSLPALERVVQKSLVKQPEDRWHTAHDLMDELKWIAKGGTEASASVQKRDAGVHIKWVTVMFAVVAGLLFFTMDRTPTGGDSWKLSMTLPAEVQSVDVFARPAISPDGRHVVFRGNESSRQSRLWVRSRDSVDGRPLEGTDGASFSPFWSPDSEFVAFFVADELKKVPISGGPVQTICNVGRVGLPEFGEGAWGADNVIVFTPTEHHVLYRVPASGGAPTPLTTFDESRQETGHFSPQFLPDGRQFIYLARSTQPGANGIYLGSLDSDEVERVLENDSNALYSTAGYLLFERDGLLLAQPFDLENRRLTEDAIPIANDVATYTDLRSNFTVSDWGVLVYASSEGGTLMGTPNEIVWHDRRGQRLHSLGDPGPYVDLDLSADGTRLAVERLESNPMQGDIWQLDLSRGLLSRLTSDPAWDFLPRWLPDGEHVAFATWDGTNAFRLHRMPSIGVGRREVVLTSGSEEPLNFSWSRDGKYIALARAGDLLVIPLSEDGPPVPFLDSKFWESDARFSPDVRYLAYASDETGVSEVYVTTFPEPGRKWRVSTQGGRDPKWRSDGQEMFYVSADGKLMAVDVKLGSEFRAGEPEELFPVGRAFLYRSNYAVSGDGQRFVVLTPSEGARPHPFTVVLNWQAGLER